MEWLSSNSQIISMFVNALMLLVWVFYAHLLLNNYRRQRRPKVLINQGIGDGLDSRCLLCNMSEEAIYISLVIAEVDTADGCWECAVTDFTSSGEAQALHDQTTQGPLAAGAFRDVRSFRSLINRVLGSQGREELAAQQRSELDLRRVSIHIIGVYGSEDQPIGASRHFELIEKDDGYRLRPKTVDTLRLSSPKQRKQVADWLRRYL